MTAIAVYPPSGTNGELQFANSSGQFDAAQAFWDSDSSKLYISGNLEVLGTQTVIDTTHLQIEDTIIGLGTGSAGEGNTGDRGIVFLIKNETNPSLYWDESEDEFRLSRVTNTPGDSVFNDPEAGGEGGYQNLKIGTLKAKSGGVFDTGEVDLADIGTDTFFFVSGTDGSKGTAIKGTATFGGDVVISGTLYGGSPLKIGGELEFKTTAGATTSIKNPSGSVKIFASEEIKIGSDEGTIRLIDLGGSTAGKIFLTGSSDPETDRRLKFLTKGQIHFHGANPNADSPGSDVFFFVSGSAGSKQSLERGISLFGGDVAISGSSVALGGLSGSLTHLTDGTSYLTEGTDITLVSASNGSISITSNAQDQRKKFVYEVTSSHESSRTLDISTVNFSLVSNDPARIDVFVNGQLMASGSSKDYVLSGNSTGLQFYFELISGDIISVRTY